MNKFVIYIISFILGYLLCIIMGNGFSVGGADDADDSISFCKSDICMPCSNSLPNCTGVKSTYNNCNQIKFNNNNLQDVNVAIYDDHLPGHELILEYYRHENYNWKDYLINTLGKGHYITDADGDDYQCDGALSGKYTEKGGSTTLANGNKCNPLPNNNNYCTGKNIGSIFNQGNCDIGLLSYKYNDVTKLRTASNAQVPEPGEYARNIYGNAWYGYKLDSKGKAIYNQCNSTPDRAHSDTIYKLKANSSPCILRPSNDNSD